MGAGGGIVGAADGKACGAMATCAPPAPSAATGTLAGADSGGGVSPKTEFHTAQPLRVVAAAYKVAQRRARWRRTAGDTGAIEATVWAVVIVVKQWVWH